MKSNFEFLVKDWPTLASLGEFAEKNLFIDSNTTLIKLRVLSENIAKLIIKEENLIVPESNNQIDRLRLIKKEDLLEKEIEQIFHSLRIIGNKATHEGYSSSFEDADIYLSMAVKLSAWFKEVYGADLNFNSEKIIYKTPEKIELNYDYEKLKKENEELIKEFNELKEANKSIRDRENKKIVSMKAVQKIKFNEKETRKIIDEQLRNAGWEADSENLRYSKGIRPEKNKKIAIAEWPTTEKRVDYALFIGLEFVGVVEAKKKSTDVISVLSEAKIYSEKSKIIENEIFVKGVPFDKYYVPFMFAANGREYNKTIEEKSGIWFLDGRKPTNHPKALKNWFSPRDIEELLNKNIDEENKKLEEEPFNYLESREGLGLRYYQLEAIKKVEEAIIKGKTKVLLTMATGTGKTRTAIGLIYRLIKSGRFKRILFLVDRASLGNQAGDNFKEAKMEDLETTFAKIYDVKEIKDKELEDTTKVHIATIQGLVRRILYTNDEELKPSVGQYDCIIVDEAHRGYILDKEMEEDEIDFKNQNDYISKYKTAIEYFEAVKIGLTATPAIHTVDIFGDSVYEYSYRQAVIDGNLVDHEPPVIIQTELNTNGIVWEVGEEVAVYNRKEEKIEKEVLEDELKIEIEGFNRRVITDDFNRTVIKELVKYINPESEEKTLIFAATDEHADKVVRFFKEEFEELGWGIYDNSIQKITGYLKKGQEEAIKRFKNEKLPNIVVTVDLLTTGIDVPEICNLVFIRRVKSRILYEQMIGRATRLCDKIGKNHFKIFDAVGLYDSLKDYTDMKPIVQNPNQNFEDMISEIKLIEKEEQLDKKREEIIAKIQRKKKLIEKQELEEYFKLKSGNKTPEEYIEEIKKMPVEDASKKLMDDIELFRYLDTVKYLPQKQYISNHKDEVIEVKRGYGKENKKPDDYLESFKQFINENCDKIEALKLLKTAPTQITRQQLRELKLILTEKEFSETYLNSAYKDLKNEEIMADIISFVKNAIDNEPLINHEEKIKIAVNKIRHKKNWNALQKKWLDVIEKQLLLENIMQKEDFDKSAFKNQGGFKKIDNIFNGELESIIDELNQYLFNISA